MRNLSSTPLVTLGIPAYNAEKFIGWAIKSVLNQTFKDFELIITDDGSTDRTVEIAKSFKDDRIIVISDGENHGISYRLNQQIDLARGKYFARMDADDIMFPDRIDNQIKYMEANPKVDAVGGQAVVIDEDNKLIGIRGELTEEIKLSFDNWITGFAFIHPTVLGKLSYFKEYKYSEKYKGIEDRDLWFRSSFNSNLVLLPQYVLFYRDPLKFKLSTYRFRRHQFRHHLRSEEVMKSIGQSRFYKLLIQDYFKSSITELLALLRLDNWIISRRNTSLNGKDEEFRIILNRSIQ